VRAVPGPQGGYALSAATRLPPLLDDDDAVAVRLACDPLRPILACATWNPRPLSNRSCRLACAAGWRR
jgi:hypothetical protein